MKKIIEMLDRSIGTKIALAAGLSLYLELLIIRLHSSFFQIFAYFKNVSLLSAFLGLGIGYAIGSKRKINIGVILPLLAVMTVLLYIARFSVIGGLLQNPISEQLSLGQAASDIYQLLFTYAFLTMVFICTAILFVPFGQYIAAIMAQTERLRAYSWNLVGSVCGILLFTFLSFLWTPPQVWLAVFVILFLPFIWQDRKVRSIALLSAIPLVAVFLVPGNSPKIDYYSPYQILTLVPATEESVPYIETSNTYYQRILDLRPEAIGNDPILQSVAAYYSLPYVFKPNPEEVLVVGSGTGNDVAAALRGGARHIDAVEIDPLILQLGEELHPEKVYQSPLVSTHIDDARSYIKRTSAEYDVIVYGLLDSHTLLSGKSGGIRLDSYVYTVEAFREARARLKEGGVISLTFATISPGLAQKMYRMLTEAFDGKAPHVYNAGYDAGTTFVASDGVAVPVETNGILLEDISDEFRESVVHTDISVDDWPFLYMPVRKYPVSYMTLLGILLIASYLFARNIFRETATRFSFVAFFLGTGFMLIETKGITELALYYGSTWIVTSIVIVGILSMGFLANLFVMKFGRPRQSILYGLLLASLIAGYAVTFLNVTGVSYEVGRIVAPIVLMLPVFFSGMAFSSELLRAPSVAVALSSNIIGAMLGGFLEYNSMYFGFRSLYIIAMVMYACAWLASVFQKKVA